jgi:hypothetical protein
MPVQNESRQRLLDARSSGHDGDGLGGGAGPTHRGQTNTYPRSRDRPHTHAHSRSRGAPSGGVLMAERGQRRSGAGPLPVALTRATATRRRKPVPNIRRCGSGIAGPHGKLPGDPGKSRSEAGRLRAAKRRRLPASPVWMRVKNRRGGRSGERPKLRTTRPALARAPATPSPHPEVLGEAEPRRTAEGETEMLTPRRDPARGKEKPCPPYSVFRSKIPSPVTLIWSTVTLVALPSGPSVKMTPDRPVAFSPLIG